MNRDILLAQFVSVFIGLLERRFADSGVVDYALCDKIESLLWPTPLAREITHAYELEMECQ